MKARYLFGLAVILAIIGIIGLRINSAQARELRNKIISQDKAGADISSDLNSLREFVFSHMNSTSKVVLTESYNRAIEAAKASIQSSASGDVYAQAQAACGQEVGTSSVAQVECVEKYLNQHLQPGANPQSVQLPQLSQYTHTFVSPAWTPDLAGFGLLAALVFALAALIVYVLEFFRLKQLNP
ncbi:hypothetical protein HY441_02020 [Candidatus Microgenomates bacterium]|nr:hypothetical protein [Candidatus Microgenomates bacterium]